MFLTLRDVKAHKEMIELYQRMPEPLQRGRWGMRMRAAGQNPLLAAQRGINLHGVYALAWSLSTLTGALAGILMALIPA